MKDLYFSNFQKYLRWFTIVSFLLFSKSLNSSQPNEEQKIKKVFLEWIEAELKSGHYLSDDSCENLNSFNKNHNKYPNTYFETVNYCFDYMNDDKKLDALITFYPSACFDNNINYLDKKYTQKMFVSQIQVLVFSKGDEYYVDNQYFKDIFATMKNEDTFGIFTIDSFSSGNFYGSLNDFYSMPSYKKFKEVQDIMIVYKNKDSKKNLVKSNFILNYKTKEIQSVD